MENYYVYDQEFSDDEKEERQAMTHQKKKVICTYWTFTIRVSCQIRIMIPLLNTQAQLSQSLKNNIDVVQTED